MRVHLGSDHAGLELKEHLLNWLADHGFEVVDHGPFVSAPRWPGARRRPSSPASTTTPT